jgi:hypothetical protein
MEVDYSYKILCSETVATGDSPVAAVNRKNPVFNSTQ